MKRATVILVKFSGPNGDHFKVVRTKNTLSPSVGTNMTEEEVSVLMRRDVEVIVDAPRGPRRD